MGHEQFLFSRADFQPTEYQKRVDDYFESAADYWKDIYRKDERLLATIYRERRELVMQWVAGLHLPQGAKVLEAGCGAGVTTAALAAQGYKVWAADPARCMIESTRYEAAVRGVASRVVPQIGDVHELAFRSNSFDLVVAIGVMPWLHSEMQATAEIARVLKPGGCLIATADNRWSLTWLLDPWTTPLTAPLRWTCRAIVQAVRRRCSPAFHTKRHSPRDVERIISWAGLYKVKSATIGYGPFSFLGFYPLSDSAGVRIHRALQRLASRFAPGLRSTGSHYVILAQKPKSTYR